MSLFMGIDLGTTFFKAAVFGQDGKLHGIGRVPVDKRESDGRCELAVDEFWRSLARAVEEALALAGARPSDVSALAYSSQANSFVLLDTMEECLTPLILWPDLRAELRESAAAGLWERDDFAAITGVGLATVEFCPHKLDWFRQYDRRIWERVAFVQTISDYLVYGLTGRRVGDASTASMTGLWDQRHEDWWAEGLASIGVSRGMMSAMLRPGSMAGPLNKAGAKRIGLCVGTPMAVGGLDHFMAGLGAGLGTLADACESTGTVLACIALARQYEPRTACCIGPTHTRGQYYRMAFSDVGTGNLDWYRETFAPQMPVATLIEQGQLAAPGAMGLRAKPVMRGNVLSDAFVGFGVSHGQEHCVRAILEATALSLADLLRRLTPEASPTGILATGGGARSDAWLQLKADLLGLEVVQVECEEPACQGAAMLAAVAAGHVTGLAEASARFHRVRNRFVPDPERHRQYIEALL